MIYPIRLYGDPVLRKTARPVTDFDDELAALAQDMFETMYDANGVGLAAPQIGLSKRLFVSPCRLSPSMRRSPTTRLTFPRSRPKRSASVGAWWRNT